MNLKYHLAKEDVMLMFLSSQQPSLKKKKISLPITCDDCSPTYYSTTDYWDNYPLFTLIINGVDYPSSGSGSFNSQFSEIMFNNNLYHLIAFNAGSGNYTSWSITNLTQNCMTFQLRVQSSDNTVDVILGKSEPNVISCDGATNSIALWDGENPEDWESPGSVIYKVNGQQYEWNFGVVPNSVFEDLVSRYPGISLSRTGEGGSVKILRNNTNDPIRIEMEFNNIHPASQSGDGEVANNPTFGNNNDTNIYFCLAHDMR